MHSWLQSQDKNKSRRSLRHATFSTKAKTNSNIKVQNAIAPAISAQHHSPQNSSFSASVQKNQQFQLDILRAVNRISELITFWNVFTKIKKFTLQISFDF